MENEKVDEVLEENVSDSEKQNDLESNENTVSDFETNGENIELETAVLEKHTSEIIEADNFTLEVSHQITVGDMLLSSLMAINIIVILLCRLIRDRRDRT